ncbi:hypothetical protein HZS_4216 [Henneguya salminicola]|uniref:40S ribosomal protein S26 n=1 Tax=Henneguya salminicola TaxID=69463 RepID=A0A6G3MKD0_HENSL|nr:hypothetical protein HZS_4216 [Henneguya salminicola]
MTKKRRNGGRSKKNRGHVKSVRCFNCRRCVAKDKAIRKFQIRNMIEASAIADFRSACIYEQYVFPKSYQLQLYCVSCAVHNRIVHVRSREKRKIREVKPRFIPTKPDEFTNKPPHPQGVGPNEEDNRL